MSSEEKIKIFKRFLKEQGVYSRAMWLYTYTNNESTPNLKSGIRNKEDVIAALRANSPWKWVSDINIFCRWSDTEEGRRVWAKINILWRMMCVEHNIKISDGKQALQSLRESIESYEEEDSDENWGEQEFIKESNTKLNELKKLVKKWRIKC